MYIYEHLFWILDWICNRIEIWLLFYFLDIGNIYILVAKRDTKKRGFLSFIWPDFLVNINLITCTIFFCQTQVGQAGPEIWLWVTICHWYVPVTAGTVKYCPCVQWTLNPGRSYNITSLTAILQDCAHPSWQLNQEASTLKSSLKKWQSIAKNNQHFLTLGPKASCNNWRFVEKKLNDCLQI